MRILETRVYIENNAGDLELQMVVNYTLTEALPDALIPFIEEDIGKQPAVQKDNAA